MRCSWCEPRLAAFADGALPPRKRAAVAAHLRSCATCRELYEGLRNVDALLETGRAAELPPEFTKDLMGRLQAVSPAVHRPLPVWEIAGLYLAAAWVALAFWAWAFHGVGAFPPAMHWLAATVNGAGVLVRGARSLWPVAPLAASIGLVLLAVDALLLAAVVVFYRSVRPRVAATLAVTTRESQ